MKQISHFWLWSLSSWTHATSTTWHIIRPELPGAMMRSFLCLSLQLSWQRSVPQTAPSAIACLIFGSAHVPFDHLHFIFIIPSVVKRMWRHLFSVLRWKQQNLRLQFLISWQLLLLLLILHQFYTCRLTSPTAEENNSSSSLDLPMPKKGTAAAGLKIVPPAGSEYSGGSWSV